VHNKTIFLAGILDNLVKNGCPYVGGIHVVYNFQKRMEKSFLAASNKPIYSETFLVG
jgi:hypothetical protein